MMENNDKLDISNGVVSMKDGTMFLRQKDKGQNQFSYFLNEKNISNESINIYKNNLENNIIYCKKKGIIYFHIVFPAKACIYSDEFKKIGLDISPIFNEHHKSKYVYYPRGELNKKHCIKDDTHYSFLGYYHIVSHLMSKIGFDIKKYSYCTSIIFRKGDLSLMNNSLGAESVCLDDFYMDNNIKRYSIRAALSGNSGEIDIFVNTKAPFKKRVLVFGDSFFLKCLDILSYFFEEIIYLRIPFIIKDIANIISPDVVLTGNAERYLVDVPSSELHTPYFLNFISHKFDSKKLDLDSINTLNAIFSGRYSTQYLSWKITAMRLSSKDVITCIKEKISKKEPFSLIRLGDGEGFILDYNEQQISSHKNIKKILKMWFGRDDFDSTTYDFLKKILLDSIMSSDLLGCSLPSDNCDPYFLRPYEYLIKHNIFNSKQLCDHKVCIDINNQQLFHEIINVKSRVGLLTCRDITNEFCQKFDVTSVNWVPIPEEQHYASISSTINHFPDWFSEVDRFLYPNFKGQLWFVGAGILGKYYCHILKSRGAIAIDIGSVFDSWNHFTKRGSVKENRIGF